MTTRVTKMQYLSKHQRKFLEHRLHQATERVLKRFVATGKVTYEGHEHDQAIAQQVIRGIRDDMKNEITVVLGFCEWKSFG